MELYIHSPIRVHGVVLNSLSIGSTLLIFTFNSYHNIMRSKRVVRKLMNNCQFLLHACETVSILYIYLIETIFFSVIFVCSFGVCTAEAKIFSSHFAYLGTR
jgi:hypothetical protein